MSSVHYMKVPAADGTNNAHSRDVIGNKSDAAASGAVTTTESLMAYVKQLVTGTIVMDAFFDVPTADTTTNATMRDVVGNKTDAAASGAVTTSESLMAYIKQAVGALNIIDPYFDVPVANTSTNATMRDAIGIKTDTAVTAVGTTKSIMAYVKGLTTGKAAATADSTATTYQHQVIGNKADVAAAGAVTATDSIVAYLKQLVNLSDSINKDGARVITVNALLSSATWNTAAAHEILAVSGSCRIKIIPRITADLAGSAGGTITLGTSASAAGILSATTTTGLDASEYWFYGTAASNTSCPNFHDVTDIITNLDIGYTLTSTTTNGNIRFYAWWEPLEANASVAAGAGGTL